MANKIIVIVLDSVGIGASPDAHKFGDEGSNTLVNTAKAVGGLNIPNLESFGIGKIDDIMGVSKDVDEKAFYGKMAETSAAKDTTSGHWEIMGVITDKPFPTYPNGFPDEVIEQFTKSTGLSILGNKTASGTEIIQELGAEHIKTGCPIVYTSADSVFQIAACEDVIPVESLYEMCERAREILKGEHNVGRVIARPFIVETGIYTRTERRRDFSVPPPEDTLLDRTVRSGYEVVGVGKIGDIFAHRGLTREIHATNNHEGILNTIECIKENFKGIVFTNLIDFDMKYGHRNDPEGYAGALESFDHSLPVLVDALSAGDILIITADHGCDPTTPGTDHSREYVPLLVFGKQLNKPRSLGIRKSFADVGATISEALLKLKCDNGKSFFQELISG
ncbi:MAG: phosphopentomutase [Candidatus Scalindua sp.]|jgi:phosphopentomutase|nr:phosphopentomutase [Candidatus Scalindua sp.]MBT5304122.1 phosphopentomutase [Candidatus Scalindua sp.]MBT6229572.1 phosphopentomutase [Candidatus Scalindua sp.]MBT6562353.1 phosphopentomutase [Candidatus Scalindua sp.]MBT7211357.1 phosphopentomutase [Candidatus Scalindua sp.]